MSFEFTLLDALQALRCPVLDALAVFFDQAGAHGEIWIAFTVVLLAFRRTRRAGLAMALALGLYMLAGHCALKPLFARPRPCDLRPEMLTLVARPHGWSFPSGHTSSAFAAAFALWLQNRRLGVPALALAGFIGFTLQRHERLVCKRYAQDRAVAAICSRAPSLMKLGNRLADTR